ncbi:hypothetical protein SDC9_100696 [bioreactor metagenome]|uniref:Uncharacterized protein n=1 Tax=bioreactor metagenome TaxID=1076179 RepID=A0A645ALX5_9ZZZZ
MHLTSLARARAADSAGSSMAARMAMMAITTRSSISVNHILGNGIFFILLFLLKIGIGFYGIEIGNTNFLPAVRQWSVISPAPGAASHGIGKAISRLPPGAA